jgi:GMP synthase-like glutamine amidotransferase
MKNLDVVQHTSAEYLGLMEDHFEGRRIRFKYYRPFTEKGMPPHASQVIDALVLLGGGPWGSAGTRDVPTLAEEVALTRVCLEKKLPIIAIGLGAQILAIAAGGGSTTAPLEFKVGRAKRIVDDALNGFLPEQYPLVTYMRDRPVLPPDAQILAVDEDQQPALFQIGQNAFGFSGHPGFKPAMGEDLVMEFEEGPADPAPMLIALRAQVRAIEDSLIPIMTGLIQMTRLMRPSRSIPIKLTTG